MVESIRLDVPPSTAECARSDLNSKPGKMFISRMRLLGKLGSIENRDLMPRTPFRWPLLKLIRALWMIMSGENIFPRCTRGDPLSLHGRRSLMPRSCRNEVIRSSNVFALERPREINGHQIAHQDRQKSLVLIFLRNRLHTFYSV
jgi:hypothetical protein